MIRPGQQIYHDLAVCARDLRANIMPMCLRPRAVEVRDFAAPEFHHAHAVIDILQLAELRVVLEGAHCEGGFGKEVLAHVKEGEVDVVDATVDEDAAVAGGVANEEACFVEEVAGLRADEERRADGAAGAVCAGNLGLGGSVRRIEATRVTRHYL